MKTNKNQQAFPRQYTEGMTKLEYFAAAALQGILTNNTIKLHNAPKYAVDAAKKLIDELNEVSDEKE